MRTKSLTIRILNQLRHDKRTIMLVLVAPLLILTLIYFVLGSDGSSYKVGVESAPQKFMEELQKNKDINIEVVELKDGAMKESVKSEEVEASVSVSEDYRDVKIYLDGTDANRAKKVEAALKQSNANAFQKDLQKIMPQMADPDYKVDYVYGEEDGSLFNNFGAPLTGLIIFFLVFLLAGINFLGERTSGTLEKMLSTPIRCGEIVAGYILSFSVLALIQTILISFFVVYILHLTVLGSFGYVVLLNLLTAVVALSMGMFFSTLANSEFQMVQFIPLVIIPQIFLCGLFDLTGGWQVVGRCMPLTYTTEGLRNVMLRGYGFSNIYFDCLILLAWALVFMFLNTVLLKKNRAV